MASSEPLPLDAIEGLVPALLKVYALVHEISNAKGVRQESATSPQELVEAVRAYIRN